MTSRRARLLLGSLAIAIAVVVVGACGGSAIRRPTATAKVNERLATLIAAAREETALTLSWPAGFLDAPEEIARYNDEFNRLYGLNLRVTFVPASAQNAIDRLFEETSARRNTYADVFLGTEAQINVLTKTGALASEPWSSWAPNIASLKLVAPDGVAVQVQSRVPGITYNSQRLLGPDIPRSLADLLKTRYRGRIATTSEAATFDRLASPDFWGPERTFDYVRKLGAQLGGFIDCGEEDRVASGDFDVFAFDCGGARVAQMKAAGAVVGWTIPGDAAFLRYLYMAVPRTAPHPNAARLWINFMLGRTAQDLMYQYEYADHYLVPGSQSFAEIDRATRAGARFVEITVEAVQSEEARGFKAANDKIQSLLRSSAPRVRR